MAGIGPNGGRQGTQYVFADGLVGLVVAAGQARNDFFAGNEVIAGKQESVVGDDADATMQILPGVWPGAAMQRKECPFQTKS